jgi:DNA-directed RNA polymerase subunit M/transcription elongation factor TFIIS
MKQIEKKQVCKCENCGNEAEMVVTCSLPDDDRQVDSSAADTHKVQGRARGESQVKGTATCTHCGNEAEMWVDL